ncbi:hypothetical protein WDW89_18490 [Deltaproteobacteria bacterium TL4]
MLKRMIYLTLILWLGSSSLVCAQFEKKAQSVFKLGVNRFMPSVAYEYSTKRLASASATEADTAVTESNTAEISTTDFYMEWVVKGLAGVEVVYGLTPGISTFTLTSDGNAGTSTKIGDISQSVQTSLLYGLNIYSSGHNDPGLKFLLGLLTGNYSVTTAYTNGGERDDGAPDQLHGFRSRQTSTVLVPAQILKIGADLLLKSAGIRIQYLMITGEVISSDLPPTQISSPQVQQQKITISGGIGLTVYTYW